MRYFIFVILCCVSYSSLAQTHCNYDGMGIVMVQLSNIKKTKNLQIELSYGEQKVMFVRNTKRKKKDKAEKISFPFATDAFVAIVENKNAIQTDSVYITVTDLSTPKKYATFRQSVPKEYVHYLCTNHKSLWANEKKAIPIYLKKIK